VAIEILYCGVCHSDIHQARNEWGIAVYPLMPGHEIVGKVTAVGANVTRTKSATWSASAAWSTRAAPAKPASRTWSNTASKARP
jgi:D-arabinose 1-dehydrogenase-like Zn-dependent alcohol dehydrogenase